VFLPCKENKDLSLDSSLGILWGLRLFRSIWVLGVFLASMGCVERELFIRSDPPAATVWLSGQERGKTPITIPFDYYGDRLLELRLRGYKVKRTIVSASPPWYQIFPLDFFFDVLWPGTLKDTQVFDFDLAPYAPEDLSEKPAILERALKLRHDAFSEAHEPPR
jgi:hypothetical protein